MIFGINTSCGISKLPQISLAYRLVKLCKTILKYHSWYLCQISLQIMLLPILILINTNSIRGGHLFYWCRIQDTASVYIITEKKRKKKQRKLKETPSGGSCIKSKPIWDSSYLQAHRNYLPLTQIIHNKHIPMSLAIRYKIYNLES